MLLQGNQGGNMAEEKEPSKKAKASGAMYVLAAVVVIAALAMVGYYGGFFGNPPITPQANATLPLATPEARLLLGSFDKEAELELQGYSLKYTANDNGAKSSYVLMKNGTESSASVEGVFGKMEGFFGAKNASDTVCLEYGGVLKCASVGNNSGMADIAASLKILRPTKAAYLNQKDDTRKHIYTGAIKLASGMTEEKVGAFDTQKIIYTLDYSNLTVQQMVTLGISPTDESLLATTDQTVTFWIDKKTSLIIKSHATYKNRGVAGFYDTEYAVAEPGAAQLPARPATIVATEAFVDFYTASTADYARRSACLASKGKERDSCFKSIAVEKNSWETCKLINNTLEYESCTLIVAQNTRNHVLCETLSTLSDECYIAVAGETGNFELCKNLQNKSLGGTCNQAATQGQKTMAEKEAVAAKLYASRNCEADTDCKAFGNENQYCSPKGTATPFANNTSPLYACLKGAPCGCQEGFCGFAKNETYYSCVNKLEDLQLEDYIKSLIPDNQTANFTKTDFGS
jgi:hypothetical protein